MNWKEELKALHLAHIKRTSPGGYELSGGDKMRLKPYDDKTTNGLTNCVYNWLRYNNHWVNRISSTGLARKINGKLVYTNGQTNRGSADLTCIIEGKVVMIEIKNVNTKDRMSKDQYLEKERVERSGGYYVIITSMQQFSEWYKSFIAQTAKLL